MTGSTSTSPRGELHGLLGENGAGKSTLMKVLSGFVRADAGEVELDGRVLSMASPRDAIAAGIGMLHQDPLVFGPFTVLDNFLLASPGGVGLDRARGRQQLADAAERYGFTFDPDAVARTLTVGERQQLEIARLLWLGARLLIFDEPTTGISADQRDKLFDILRRLAGDGLMVIFVSHKLEEIELLCDRVTIMRAGQVVGREVMPVPPERLVEMMFGEILVIPDRPPATLGRTVLEVRDAGFADRIEVTDVTIDLAEAEVLGLAGLEGSGQRTFLRGCAGLIAADRGSISVDGVDLTTRRYNAFRSAGIHLLPAGRLEEGLVPGLTIAEHFELVSANRSFFVDWSAADSTARERIASDSIKGTIDSDRRVTVRRQPATAAAGDAAVTHPPVADGAPDPRPRHRVGGVGVVAAPRTAHRRHRDHLRLRRPRRADALQRSHRRVLRGADHRRRRRWGD